MNSNEIRTRFLKFFEACGHRVLPSSSLVPAHDPTLLFTNAGMNQFKDVFLGREKRDYARAATSQKCVRAGGKHNDLEQVGRTTRHHTFFEMLGNFSFGDYFKKEAIPWAWELITKDYAIPAEKLYITVFREDNEAEEIWAKDVGVPRQRIFRLDEHDNFWAMGDTGPCGPCSEIHYDLGPAASDLGHPDCKFPCECGRYTELWNLVFMQFDRDEQGHLNPLPRPSIDTGAGLERLAAVLQGKLSNFDTDLFRPLIEEAAGLANVEYGANHDTDVSLRIIADHARAATFLISDGVLPSNEGRGYVVRLIMRRALYHGQTLGLNEPFLYKMAGHVVQMMKDAYPELLETERHVVKAIKIEEERYAHTTRVGIERLNEELEAPSREAVKAVKLLDRLPPSSEQMLRAIEQAAQALQPNEQMLRAVEEAAEALQPSEQMLKAIEEAAKALQPSEQMLKAIEEAAEALQPSEQTLKAIEVAAKALQPSEQVLKAIEGAAKAWQPSGQMLKAVEEAAKAWQPSEQMLKAIEDAAKAWQPSEQVLKAMEDAAKALQPSEQVLKAIEGAAKALQPSDRVLKAVEEAAKAWQPSEQVLKAMEDAAKAWRPSEKMLKAIDDAAKAWQPSEQMLKAMREAAKAWQPSQQMLKAIEEAGKAIQPSKQMLKAIGDMAALNQQAWRAIEGARLPGDRLFRLHDTYGLRPDFVADIARVRGVLLDREGYEAEMEKQRERARASWRAVEKKLALPAYLKLSGSERSQFLGYEAMRAAGCRVLAILPRGIDEVLSEAAPGKGPTELEVVLDKTPFYAEAGGQVGDKGWFMFHGDRVARVEDTYSPVSGIIAHRILWAWPPPHFKLRTGDIISAEVDEDLRRATMRNHTATHLLHAALRKTLGTHVKQAGSLVAPDRLRFDFAHYAPLDEQDLLDIEDLVNEHILKNEEVVTTVMDLDGAVNSGAVALFGEKYADQVRVLTIDDFSKELCGGTHVRRTGDIGLFKIISEGSVAAGTRRIEAVTGEGVLKQLRQTSQILALLADSLHAKPEELLQAIEKLAESEKKLRKELEAQQMKRAAFQADELAKEAREVKGVRVVSARVEVTDRAAMRQMVDDLRAKLQSGVIVLGSVSDGKVSLVAAVTKDLTNKLDAGKIVKQAAAYVEGSGGGRKDLAEAGGKNPAKLDESLQAVPSIIEAML